MSMGTSIIEKLFLTSHLNLPAMLGLFSCISICSAELGNLAGSVNGSSNSPSPLLQ